VTQDQIIAQVDALSEELEVAIYSARVLAKTLYATGDVVFEDIASDLQLSELIKELANCSDNILKAQRIHLPYHFNRMSGEEE
jgi:flagellar biosynthesis protein FlhB